MKKFITLFFAVSAITTAGFSQSKAEESRRVILGKEGSSTTDRDRTRNGGVLEDILGGSRTDDSHYPNGTNESRRAEIDEVNREYDRKIQTVRNNPIISDEQKQRVIRQLEAERARKIQEINDRYGYGNRNNEDYNNNKGYKRNGNGKKLGWEKGVGNPHRTGSGKDFGYEKNKKKSDDRYDDDRNYNYDAGKGKQKNKASGKGNGNGKGKGNGKKG